MLPILACLLATQAPSDQPPRLRTILPNGAAILVERVPGAKNLSVDLFASSRGTEETPISNGLRHLLEHLEAKGPNGDIDARLETQGGFLSAETSRDAMCFRLNLPPGKLDLAVKTIGELMQMPSVTQDQIKRESMVIEQEVALRDDNLRFSTAAWSQLYGEKGLDPIGNLDVIRNATPEMLEKIHKTQFLGSNLAVVVVGDVDLDQATKDCSAVLSTAQKGDPVQGTRPLGPVGKPTVDVPGRAYAVSVRGWKVPETVARLAASFVLANEADDCFVTYTPSSRPGVIILGSDTNKAGLAKAIAEAKPNELFEQAKMMVKLWLAAQLQTTEGIADLRGLLMVDSTDMKPEVLFENLNAMTPQQFAEGIAAFRSAGTVVVEGR